MYGASGSPILPFAVGVLALAEPTDSTGRVLARLDLALDTYKLGYFLLDIIEISTHGTGCLATELLVSRATPDALVTRGPLDTDWLNALANRHRLVIRSGEEHPRPRDGSRKRARRGK
jgi:hypothetical protein